MRKDKGSWKSLCSLHRRCILYDSDADIARHLQIVAPVVDDVDDVTVFVESVVAVVAAAAPAPAVVLCRYQSHSRNDFLGLPRRCY